MADKTLTATKSFSYRTRRLLPGDLFTAPHRDAHILVAIGKAKMEREPGSIAPPPPGLVAKVQGNELADLRAEYQRRVGKRPFNGWNATTLREKIAAANQVC